MINVLIITPNFNKCCGVSNHVYLLLKELKHNKTFNIFFVTNRGDNLEKISELGIYYEVFPFDNNRKEIFGTIKFFLFLKNFCKKNKINIIHTHHRYPEFVSWTISKFYKVQTVTTVHSKVTDFSYLSFRSSKIICVSNYIKEILINDFKKPASKLVVMYNFICDPVINNERNGSLKKRLGICETDIVLLYAGRFSKIKGIDVLLKAYKKIEYNLNNVVLLMVGENVGGDGRIELSSGSNSFITDATDKIHEYYRIANIVILPSRVEALGYIMLEAGLYKIPFIGSNTGGIAEFINNRENGMLFNPEDETSLADTILDLLKDHELQKLLTENLHKKVTQICNKDLYMEKLANIYMSLLEND